MTKAIYPIVGMRFRDAVSFVRDLLKRGTEHELLLEREPDNRVDPNAVRVIAYGKHIGYVAAAAAKELAAEMDMKSMKKRGAKLIDDGGFPAAVIDE